jgi:hypothetical protein
MAIEPNDPAAIQRSRVARRWGKRMLIAIVTGVAIGAAIGVVGVNTLEPGRPGQPDSLQVLIDSLANSKVATRTDTVSVPKPVEDTAAAIDSAAVDSTLAVPNLADVEEGDARRMLADLGFDIGDIIFRSSPKAAGTVLSTFPIAGERVKLPATINLVLSDGRGRRDSLPAPLPLYR